MKLYTIVATLLTFLGGGVISSSISAQPVSKTPDTYEFKVMLNNSLFTSDSRDTNIDNFMEIINKQPKIEVNKDKKEKSRIVSYLDTNKCGLKNNNYILRKRFTLKNDVPDRLKITLKYRSSTPIAIGGQSFQAKPSSELTASKYEADIVRNASSQTQKKFSYSGSVEMGKIKTMSDLLSLYPVLSALNISDNKKIKMVNKFVAFETVIEIGIIRISDQKCDTSFSFWYKDKEKKHLIASEFSYVCSKITDEGEKLYQAILQQKLGQESWVNANPSTKTAIAYGDFCDN